MGRQMSRRWPGKGRIEHDRLNVIVANTARKSGSDIMQLAMKLSDSAWSLKLRPINTTKMNRGISNVETMTI